MQPTLWQIPPHKLQITSQELHIWQANIPPILKPSKAASFFKILHQEERVQASRFRFERSRAQFIHCRALLRLLLSSYLNKRPEALSLIYGIQGKPNLAANPQSPSLHFNLSHAGNKVLLVFSKDSELGVDLEKVADSSKNKSPLPWSKLAKRYFAAEEIRFLKSFAPKDQERAACRLWTLKEAYLKAQGLGLAGELKNFAIGFKKNSSNSICQEAWLSKSFKSSQKTNVPWTLKSFEPTPGYVASWAIPTALVKLSFWDGDKFLSNF